MNDVKWWRFLAVVVCSALAVELNLRATGVVFPTGPAAWTVTVKTSDSTSPPDKADPSKLRLRVYSINTVITSTIRVDQFHWSNDKTTNNWYIENYLIYGVPYNNSIYGSLKANERLPSEEIYFDAVFFDWTKQIAIPKSGTYAGKQCLVFEKPRIINVFDINNKAKSDLDTVYADPVSHLLVALINNSITYEFLFNANAPSQPEMPPGFADQLAKLRKAFTPPVILNHNRG